MESNEKINFESVRNAIDSSQVVILKEARKNIYDHPRRIMARPVFDVIRFDIITNIWDELAARSLKPPLLKRIWERLFK